MSTGNDFNPTIPILDSAAGETGHNKPAAVYVVNPGGGTGGPVTIVDGGDVTQGALADAAVVTDASGSLSAKLRGLIVVLLRAFALSTPLRVDPVGATAQPVTVASLPALPANQSTNIAQINGHTAADGAGNVANGVQRVVQATGSSINTGQVSVDTTSGGRLILASNSSRISITIINNGTTDVYIGLTGVSITTGQLLVGIKGYPIKIRTSAAIYGIVSAASQTVSYLEEVQ